MTTEPNALDLFKADPVCQSFDIRLIENSEEKQSFVQDQWNAQTDDERLSDAQVSNLRPFRSTFTTELTE
jgi:hypothetical protein